MLGAKGTHSTIIGDESMIWVAPKPDPLPEPSKPDGGDDTGIQKQDEVKKNETNLPIHDDNKPDDNKPIEKPDDKPK